MSKHHRLAILILIGCAGCLSESRQEVVVYTALDRDFSEPMFAEFTEKTGIRVLAKYDTESTKTVGLTSRIISEADHPRCDVFWNNEILHTLRLKKLGLLAAYETPVAADYPAKYYESTWHGFAARARVILVNRKLLGDEAGPTSIQDLVDPRWKKRVGIAKPLFGTTATQFAVLFASWGEEKATEFARQVHDNAEILSGNKQVAMAVSRGQIVWGLTDTDDALVEIERGGPVEIVLPDQEEGSGTLLIPNTVGIIRGAPHPEAAQQFVDYVLSADVEAQLAAGRSGQIPLNRQVTVQSRAVPGEFIDAQVDYAAAADAWETASRVLRDIFARP
ncbi:MAG: extracellular solute-binding protein [Planctomycetales bacterium]|nr:extracellular solute-binding protein [Planctomycetales bacterium]